MFSFEILKNKWLKLSMNKTRMATADFSTLYGFNKSLQITTIATKQVISKEKNTTDFILSIFKLLTVWVDLQALELGQTNRQPN